VIVVKRNREFRLKEHESVKGIDGSRSLTMSGMNPLLSVHPEHSRRILFFGSVSVIIGTAAVVLKPGVPGCDCPVETSPHPALEDGSGEGNQQD
jgi:hypothetical protein